MTGIGAVYLPTAVVPEWQRQAACGGLSRLMYPPPDNPAAIDAAKRVCDRCPVFGDCRAWMTGLSRREDPGGVLAGTTLEERTGRAERRTCASCGVTKPVEAFTAYKATGRVRARCKVCVANQAREAYRKRKATKGVAA